MNPETSWSVAEPCSADWETMRGNDRRRFCEHCRKHVHNVSAMNKSERAEFAKASGAVCIRYELRPDGRFADFSFLASLRRWFPILRLVRWSALVALCSVVLNGCMMGARPISGRTRMPSQVPNLPDKTSARPIENH